MKTIHLLIVDDDETIRRLMRDFFEGLGYEVATAANGSEALKEISRVDFDCIISDRVMPDMDGVELLKQLRTVRKKVPFLMVTGYPTIQTAVEVMKEGAYDYISKPVHMEDVRLKVERALHTKGLERSLKRLTGVAWAILISIPIWLILGIILGKVW